MPSLDPRTSARKTRYAVAGLVGAGLLASAAAVSALPSVDRDAPAASAAGAGVTAVSEPVAAAVPEAAPAQAAAAPEQAAPEQAAPEQAAPGQAAAPEQAAPAKPQKVTKTVMLKGQTKASYFWDDSSGRAGDTGLPASGKPMQKGMIASPSWPLFTEGYVIYKGKKAKFFVGDRGPGVPSSSGVMIDLDAKTFADLTGGTFNPGTLGVDGNGGMGHIKVDYVITKWGDGPGKKNDPVPFSTGAWGKRDGDPAKPVQITVKP
ncbi:hypothetical protein ACFYSC_25615 [Streptosporangium sp. NPDC004379]|uniref:hypothetical protein n=1 Tax=Streptosporangium sp. NPDC004379 TaxID=3366189 RepID=UPI0036C2E539